MLFFLNRTEEEGGKKDPKMHNCSSPVVSINPTEQGSFHTPPETSLARPFQPQLLASGGGLVGILGARPGSNGH